MNNPGQNTLADLHGLSDDLKTFRRELVWMQEQVALMQLQEEVRNAYEMQEHAGAVGD